MQLYFTGSMKKAIRAQKMQIPLNIIIIALLVQIGISLTRSAFEFGQDFIIEFIAEEEE